MQTTFPFDQGPSSRRLIGIGAVVALHLLLVYALVSGLARNVVEIIKKPLEAKLVVELPPPPPPPPPPPKEIVKAAAPKLEAPPPPFVPPPEVAVAPSTAPVITASAEPPKVEYKIEPPPPPPAPAPAPAPKPVNARQELATVCPTQVTPEMPAKAIQEGVTGVVRAQVHVSGGQVREVTILSGPRVFHAAVKAAMSQYKCVSSADDVTALQEFNFNLQ